MAGSDNRHNRNLLGEYRKPPERRKKQDWVVRMVSITALLGWLLCITSIFLIRTAQPDNYEWARAIQGSGAMGAMTRMWNTPLLRTSFLSLVFAFLGCLIGFFANMTRMRRKSDRFNKSIIILGILSFIGCIVFLFNYNLWMGI